MSQPGAVLVACLFLASCIVIDAQLTGVYDQQDIRLIDFDKSTFILTCNVGSSVAPNAVVNWLKNGTAVSNTTLQGRYNVAKINNDAILTIKPVREDDYGDYMCRLQDDPTVFATFRVLGKPLVRLAENHNVVQEQKIKITCKVIGKPRPEISWMYDNGSSNVTIIGSNQSRITLEENDAKVKNAMLILSDAEPSDAGKYYCVANQTVVGKSDAAGTTLRVKDKYAALWPFLGICAEVLVLCAVILVYEKRRVKTGDMEDSDTDNHDQKKS